MTVSTTFVLGAKDTYFFNTPTHWAHHNLPGDINALFTKTPPIRDVIELALGVDGAYFVSYRDHDGGVLCKHYNLPNPLVEYLYASHPGVIRDLSTLSITLGPYESYYAWDRTSASWSNVPAGLEKSLLNRLESQDAWRTTWKADGYEAPCFAVHLMPPQANAYVLILTNGKTFSNLPEHTWADYAKMADKLPAFVQQMAPLPPMPQQRVVPQPLPQPQPQPFQTLPPNYKTSQRGQAGCCPSMNSNVPHTCCPPAPMIARPWPLPPINAPHS
ncbi:hypothetical protein C7974DRAFT_430928 [Boeremia exigua]|uniref:uncharacterized protein n=1 Tax=Boeremia exigua TaxID=749465 RepID=UPI001E8D119D|nr:uncharacterized protein C7974DRAFT_430928 [Boeremia exigua]KAH6642474.1 hypothetical protein C7974DRAFT_430928 [Boeremia exigua]